MTQRAALCQALLNGETLSIMDGFKKFGITNLPREISRGVERTFSVKVVRVPKNRKTRYGTSCNYYEYNLNARDVANKKGVNMMKEYVRKQLNSDK
jgi:hypothetical protein